MNRLVNFYCLFVCGTDILKLITGYLFYGDVTQRINPSAPLSKISSNATSKTYVSVVDTLLLIYCLKQLLKQRCTQVVQIWFSSLPLIVRSDEVNKRQTKASRRYILLMLNVSTLPVIQKSFGSQNEFHKKTAIFVSIFRISLQKDFSLFRFNFWTAKNLPVTLFFN